MAESRLFMKKRESTITKTSLDGLEKRIRSSITDLARNFTVSLGKTDQKVDALSTAMFGKFAYLEQRFELVDQRFQSIDQQFVVVNTKLDALMESVSTRQEMHNLVRELKHGGITIDESKVFIS